LAYTIIVDLEKKENIKIHCVLMLLVSASWKE